MAQFACFITSPFEINREILYKTNFWYFFRRGIGGLPTRLINKNRAGSVQSGSAGADAESLQDESSLDGEEMNEK